MSRSATIALTVALLAAACGSDSQDSGEPAARGSSATAAAAPPPGGDEQGQAADGQAGDPVTALSDHVAATCATDDPVEAPQIEPSPREDVPSALRDRTDPAFPDPLVDPDEIVSGGPPPDGIPAIDDPKFVRQCSVDWLAAGEPVLVLDMAGDVRAYPLQVMTWHELVNDIVGSVPVTVSYCPLCNSAVAYDRRVGNRVLDFGTSGSLYNSALVMYDRQTESLWSHFTAGAVVGVLTGTELDRFPLQTVSFADYRAARPDGLVLSRDTGFDRDYGRNPYTNYDNPESRPLLFRGEYDRVLAAKTRVLTVERGGEAVAIVQEALVDQRVLEFDIGGETLVALAKPGTASALDTRSIVDGRDIGATGVFVPEADGQRLTITADGDTFRDVETGSMWNILGRATDGPLRGSQLQPVEHLDTFWFAWSAFQPETTILLAEPAATS